MASNKLSPVKKNKKANSSTTKVRTSPSTKMNSPIQFHMHDKEISSLSGQTLVVFSMATNTNDKMAQVSP